MKINYFGNVLATVSDRRQGVDGNTDEEIDYYEADVVSASDYAPFGMGLVGRTWSSEQYRYGFYGQEKSTEINADGNSMTAEFWQYDARLGRRWNVDPLLKEYEIPYAIFANNPIIFIDPNGLDTVNTFQRRNAIPRDVYKMKNGNFVTKGENGGWFTSEGVAVGFKKDAFSADEKKRMNMLVKIATGSAVQKFEENALTRNRILEYNMAMTAMQNTSIRAFNEVAIIIASGGIGSSFSAVRTSVFAYSELGRWIGPVAKNSSEKVLAARGDFSKVDWFDVITSSVKDRFAFGLGGKISVEILNAGIDLRYDKGLQVAIIGTKSDASVFADISASFIKAMLGEVLKELESSKTTDQVYRIVIDQLKTSLKDAAK